MPFSRGFIAAALLVAAPPLAAQGTALRLPRWQPELLAGTQCDPRIASVPAASRDHTTTGLLIGAAVGAAATTAFLIAFCSDSDTVCQADEVGRAALIIGVPITALGALIGALAD